MQKNGKDMYETEKKSEHDNRLLCRRAVITIFLRNGTGQYERVSHGT